MLGLRLSVKNDSGTQPGEFGSAGASPSQGDFTGTTEHQLGDDVETPLCVVDRPHGMAERTENVRRVADWCR